MSPKKSGNVPRESEDVQSQEKPLFQEGDVLALTQAALRKGGTFQKMSCRLLYAIGWPNEFLVIRTFEDPENGPCVRLWPCCGTLVDRQKNQFRCGGHPSVHFQKIDVVRMPKKGDKTSSVVLPFGIGELLGFEYHEDSENPEFVARVAGKEGVLTGVLATLLKKFAESANII